MFHLSKNSHLVLPTVSSGTFWPLGKLDCLQSQRLSYRKYHGRVQQFLKAAPGSGNAGLGKWGGGVFNQPQTPCLDPQRNFDS